MRFSTKFSTFASWLRSANKNSAYTRRIERLHTLAPNLSLSKLGKLKVSSLDLSKKSWNSLSPEQIYNRKLSLEAKRLIKQGYSLTNASKEVGLRKSDLLRHLGQTVKRNGKRWAVNSYDTISRGMTIYENGTQQNIIITNSKDAEIIGKYHNAVKQYLRTGDTSFLKPFKKIKIKDEDGVKHSLETNPEKLRDIDEAQEDSEYFEVYDNEQN